MKFSVIVPVYNVEKYLKECIESILKQTYENFELIIVNDGSTDSSVDVIKSFDDKRIRFFDCTNSGVAVARNFGISKCTGDYFIFVDSDDTINEHLLEKIKKVLDKEKVDLVKYQIQMIDGTEITYNEPDVFENLDGEEAFKILLKNDLFVSPVTYAYSLAYWRKCQYSYIPGRVHEDFGLTPIVVVNADSVTSIAYKGYNYYARENSIMTNNSEERIIAKNNDSLVQYDNLLKMIDDIKVKAETRELFKSYVSNGMINRCRIMQGKILDDYLEKLQNRDITKYMLSDTFFRKIKKILFKLFPKLYIKIFYSRG